jgi:hypothetical protein
LNINSISWSFLGADNQCLESQIAAECLPIIYVLKIQKKMKALLLLRVRLKGELQAALWR